MADAFVDGWNNDAEIAPFREILGLRLIEAGPSSASAAIEATSFNQLRGYFAGHALPGMVEAIAGIVANYSTWTAQIERGERGGIGWVMTRIEVDFIGNSRSGQARCEAIELERDGDRAVIETRITDGDREILLTRSHHVRR